MFFLTGKSRAKHFFVLSYFQVLGGVSDEQAAEAAAHQTEATEDEDAAVADGDGHESDDNALDAIEGVDEDVPKAVGDAEDEGLKALDADTADSTRKSGKKRAQDGHKAGILFVLNTSTLLGTEPSFF